MSIKKLPSYLLIALLIVVSPAQALAADANVGNEVVDAANTSLTRTGAGTAANPYKLHLNVGNANTWTALQTFNSGLTTAGTLTANGAVNVNNTLTVSGIFTTNNTLNANGAISLGDGGDAASISGTSIALNSGGTASVAGTSVQVSTGDNNANAFFVQQGTLKYLQLVTTNSNESLSFGNSTTNPIFNFLGSGAASFGGNVTVSGTLTAANGASFNNITANGNSTFIPSGTNDVTVVTDSDSKLVVTGLSTETGDALCLNASNEVILCSAIGGGATSLQDAYGEGSSINTTDAKDIAFTLSNTATDSNFVVTTAAGSDGYSRFNLADGSNASLPSQLVLFENNDNDESLPVGIKVQSAPGGVNTAVDLSDSEIITAIALGSNDINGTNVSITGSNGNILTSGDVAVNGGDITTNASTVNVFNTAATTANIVGAATNVNIGASFGTNNLRGSTISFPNAFTIVGFNATATFNDLVIGGGYGSTGMTVNNTGNIQSDGNLTIEGTSSLTGNVTTQSDLAINGGDITTNASTGNIFNSNATTLNIGGGATSVSIGASVGTTNVNNNLTANSGINVPAGQNLNASGATTFAPNGTSDVTVSTDSDSTVVLTGLQTATGDGLCIDGSDNIIKCSGTPSDVRLKKNITKLSDVLPRVLKAQGVKYDLLKEVESAPGEGKNIGFIAQELEVLFPEVVKTDANGIKSVDYEKMTAVLVESTKEQQKQIDELKAEIEALKAAINH